MRKQSRSSAARIQIQKLYSLRYFKFFQRRLVIPVAAALALAACDGGAPPAVTADTRLPVSINEVMVSQINHAADPFWQFAWATPETDRDWRELERLVYQVQVGALMIKVPGTGPQDQAWTQEPEWQRLAERLNQDAVRAIAAVRSREQSRVHETGDQLVETCDACHRVFNPDMPQLTEFRELSTLPAVSN